MTEQQHINNGKQRKNQNYQQQKQQEQESEQIVCVAHDVLCVNNFMNIDNTVDPLPSLKLRKQKLERQKYP